MSRLLLMVICWIPLVLGAQNKNEFRVATFSPEGKVLKADQIRVSFSVPAVRMGDPSLPAPIEGGCLRNGQGRWIDNKNWVFDFSEALKSAGKCTFQLRKNLVSLEGQALTGKTEFVIETGGGHLEEVRPSWGEIDPEQVFVVRTDRAVNAESVEQLAYFTISDLGDRVPVKVLRGAEEKKAEEAYLSANSWEKKEFQQVRERILFLRSSRIFPEGASTELNWPAGIQTKDGVTTVEITTREFQVRPEFRATGSCERAGGENDPCVPLTPVTLNFNTSVNCEVIKGVTMKGADGKVYPSDIPEDGEGGQTCTRVEFKGPFPENADLIISLPKGVKDVDGRPLKNEDRFPITMKTGMNPPLLKFAAGFGLIEDSPKPAIPVTVRMIEPKIKMRSASVVIRANDPNIEKSYAKIIDILGTVRADGYGVSPRFASDAQFKNIVIDKPNADRDFEVMGIPVQGKGFHAVELESPRLGRSLRGEAGNYYVRSAALVTGLAAHVKHGGDDAFVWVTKLSSATPVAGAEVTLVDCHGKIQSRDKTAKDGSVRLVGAARSARTCGLGDFYIFASMGDDLTFTYAGWSEGIESWRFRVDTVSSIAMPAHTIFDRTLFKPGETVSMKHVFRRASMRGLVLPASKDLPTTLTITHASGLQKFEFPLTWDREMGTALSTWKIPPEAKLGLWTITLDGGELYEPTGRIRVENFKIPFLKAHLKTPEQEIVGADAIQAQLGVEYLAGGPAGGIDAIFRWSLERDYFRPQDESLSDFQFLEGDVKGGLRRKSIENETIETSQTPVKLDAAGAASLKMSGWAKSPVIRQLSIQAEYRDPNGENQVISRSRRLWPTDRLVGVRPVGWARLKSDANFEVVVTDVLEKPLANVPVEMEMFSVQYFSHRKRLVGGYYEYEDFEKIESLGALCKGKTNSMGRLACKGSAPTAGRVYGVARIKDGKGVEIASHASQWLVAKNEELWFGADEGDRIDLTSSKKHFEPGETAEFQVQTPFPEATVLVTVEREGVIHHEVKTIKSSDPRIQIKVDENWAPNVFVSALLLRGRSSEFQPTAMLDLGKPSMKMGLTEIKVGWKKHILNVGVEVDKKVYQIREKAKARIKVTDVNGRPSRADLAIAVVDEGLLQLMPNKSWDLLPKMMASRGLLVRTASSQGLVIGKRHFGLKARPAGGDGGGAGLRENFDPLLLWVGRVMANESGQAELEIPLNDSLSSFRVVAIALNGRDQFGTGDTAFRTTRDLMVFAGAPAFVRTGDDLGLEYTLRNSSEKPLNLEVSLVSTPARQFDTRKLSLKVGESSTLRWPFKAPEQSGNWSFEISSKADGRELDRMKSRVEVKDLWDISTRQAVLEQVTGGKASLYLDSIPNALPGSSRVEVALSSSLVGGQEGLREFWLKYPYACLEQKISRIIGLNDVKAWSLLEPTLDSYMDPEGRLRLYQGMSDGQATLNIFVLELTQAAGLKMNEEIKERLLSAIEAKIQERGQDKDLYNRFDDEDRLAAIALLSRNGRFQPEWIAKMTKNPNSWSTGAVLDWLTILQKETTVPGRQEFLPQAETLLRSRMSFTGTKLVLSDERSLDRWWSYKDRDSTTAKILLAKMNTPAWKEDLPRMMRGFVARQEKGSWNLTLANAWGRIALDSYRKTFETVPVAGQTQVALASEKKTYDWVKGAGGQLALKGVAKKETMTVTHAGAGAPWAVTRLLAAVPLQKPVSSGFFLEKVILNPKKSYSRGDVVDIELRIKTPSDTPWVSIRDPLPPGGIVLGSGLGQNDSEENDSGSWGPFEERKYHEFVVTFVHLYKGDQVYRYKLRLNQSGDFTLPATRIEAMYDTDVFAEVPNTPWKVISAQ